jgi:transposase
MVAAIGTGDSFSRGRDFAAWLGLVPRQISIRNTRQKRSSLIRSDTSRIAPKADERNR